MSRKKRKKRKRLRRTTMNEAIFQPSDHTTERLLESKAEPDLNHDSSTNNLIRRYRKAVGSRS
jgi:hypothetical protein